MIPGIAAAEGRDVLDAFELSKRCLVVVLFAKTTSPNFQMAENLASRADTFQCFTAGKIRSYIAGFGRTSKQAGLAQTLIEYINQWSSARYLAFGRLQHGHWSIEKTLSCYQMGANCRDFRAHCLVVRQEPFRREMPHRTGYSVRISMDPNEMEDEPIKARRFIFPCRIVSEQFDLDRDHPSSWIDQVNAEAVRKQVDWCPLFDLENFRQYD